MSDHDHVSFASISEFAGQIKGDTERSRKLLQILGIKPQ